MQHAKDLMRTARKREAASDLDGAVAIYEEILGREPDHAGALHGLGLLMNRQGEFSRAAECLERAVVAVPNDPVRHVDLGESYRNLGRYLDAIGCCVTALKLRPDYPEGLNTLGWTLQKLGDLNGALEQFRRAHAIRPDFSPAHTNAGRILQEIGALEEAVAHFRRGVELEPDCVLTLTNLGLALLESGRAMEALPHFREAVRRGPDVAVVHHNLANVLRILGRTAEARGSYREAIRLDSKLMLSCFHMSLTLRDDGLLAEAAKWCRIAADLEPDNPDIWKNLAGLYDELREPDEAFACRRRIGAMTSGVGPAAATSAEQRVGRGVQAGESTDNDAGARGIEELQDGIRSSSETIVVGAGPREFKIYQESIDMSAGLAALGPGPALGLARKGLSLLAREQAAEALSHLQEALLLRPDAAILHHHLGNALRILGRYDAARASYLKAVRLDPDLALSYLHVGITLRLEGLLDEALKWHELAVEREPNNPNFLDDLAELYLKLDQADKAVECRRRLLSLVPPGRVDARLELGAALEDDGRADEAMEQYRIALRTHPYSPQVHLALSGIYEEWGDLSEAESEARAAIRLEPRFPAAHARLATLLRGRLPDADLDIIERLLAKLDLGRHIRVRLLFGLAHVLDARGDYPRAAACLSEANSLNKDLRRAEGLIYRPEHNESFVGRLIEAFSSDFFRRTAGLGLETRRPVFIFGLPRSGTTLVEQILASHPRIYGAGERLFGRRSFEKLPAVAGRLAPPIELVASVDESSLKRLAGEHLAQLNALDLGRYDRIVDKLPDNYLYIGLLVAMFPNAVFIHCCRDLRDVAVSCWMNDFRNIRWASDLDHIASRFRQYRRLAAHWHRVFPAPILRIDYEETVTDLEGTARRLLDAVGLPWDSACLDFHRTRRIVRTASLSQVRQPLYTRSLARWKHYQNELADLFAAITDELTESG